MMIMTSEDFKAKVEDEGIVYAVSEYGLKSSDCEAGETQDAWRRIEDWWKQRPVDAFEVFEE